MGNAKNVIVEKRRSGDRRKVKTDYKRRVYDRRTRTFKYERTIHLSDTNLFGSAYFARFFDIQGEAREEFLQFLLDKDMQEFIGMGYVVVTVSAFNRYQAPLMLYDRLVVEVQVVAMKRTKAKMQFTIRRLADDAVCAIGEQWIGFTTQQGKPVAIPEIVVKNVLRIAPPA